VPVSPLAGVGPGDHARVCAGDGGKLEKPVERNSRQQKSAGKNSPLLIVTVRLRLEGILT
jgi:hypothetical protein